MIRLWNFEVRGYPICGDPRSMPINMTRYEVLLADRVVYSFDLIEPVDATEEEMEKYVMEKFAERLSLVLGSETV